MEAQMDERKTETKIDKNKDRTMLLASTLLLSTLARYNERKDPAMRHMLFIDKFLVAVDLLVNGFVLSDDVSEETKKQVQKAADVLRTQFMELEQWIEHPCYSPFH